jgi:hypothetical protein
MQVWHEERGHIQWKVYVGSGGGVEAVLEETGRPDGVRLGVVVLLEDVVEVARDMICKAMSGCL